MFILSEAYYHNSEVTQDTSQLIGYHDNQSGSAPPDALCPVAQFGPAFHTWEYWESVWAAREWREDSPAVQTWMDVESILSARGIRRKWPSICRQGNVSKHIVCGLIIEGLACWSGVWCNWLKTNGLPEIWLLQAQLTGAIRYTASANKLLCFPQVFHSLFCLSHCLLGEKHTPLYLKSKLHWFSVVQMASMRKTTSHWFLQKQQCVACFLFCFVFYIENEMKFLFLVR